MMGADPQHPHENPGSIEMAPQVGALVIAEVPGLVPVPTRKLTTICNLCFRGPMPPFGF